MNLLLENSITKQCADDTPQIHVPVHQNGDPTMPPLFLDIFRVSLVQSDPIGLVGGLNRYGYVEGNSLRFIDSLGLEPAPPLPPGWNSGWENKYPETGGY